MDLASYLSLADYYVAPPAKTRDPITGFIVGGENTTALILGLTELNGRKIVDLQADMRPGASSTAGFLGANENLLEIMAADNRYVVDELGLSHQQLARDLHAMATIGQWQSKQGREGSPFTARGE
ncbi:MAG: hypothetical protein ACREHD_25160 [Pirellulales bacterium]